MTAAYLTHVPPAALREHWPRVRAGLERIIKKTGARWIPEDVYRALANNEAWLALVKGDAWLVWQRYPGDDGRGMLFVWACEGRGLVEHEAAVRAELEVMARASECRIIRMISPRKGWGADGYWQPVGYVYEREVK